MNRQKYIDTMARHYIRAAIWSCTTDDDTPFDEIYSVSDIDQESLERVKADCLKFYTEAKDLLVNWSAEQAGHDFYLSRCGHGAGFFDRHNFADTETCDKLQRLTNKYGSRYCFSISDTQFGME